MNPIYVFAVGALATLIVLRFAPHTVTVDQMLRKTKWGFAFAVVGIVAAFVAFKLGGPWADIVIALGGSAAGLGFLVAVPDGLTRFVLNFKFIGWTLIIAAFASYAYNLCKALAPAWNIMTASIGYAWQGFWAIFSHDVGVFLDALSKSQGGNGLLTLALILLGAGILLFYSMYNNKH